MDTNVELQKAVEAYGEGNQESFNQIYELSYKYLHTCVIHVMKDEEITMDMLQETYLEISKSISQLKNTEGFLNWAATIANRKCYAYLKKKKDVVLGSYDEEEGTGDFFENIADNEDFIPETVLQDREKQRLIREIIDDLTDIQRLCVIGFYYNEQKQEEIAEELGIPVNTVKSHLNRAKAKIKDAVVDLDEKKGTRLYSFAPFMLLFFGLEAEACELAPLDISLGTAVGNGSKAPLVAGESTQEAGTAAHTMGANLKATGMTLKAKVAIGVAVAGTVIVVGAGIGVILSNNNTTSTLITEGEETQTEEIQQSIETTEITEHIEEMQELTEEEPTSFGIAGALQISGIYDYYGYANQGLIPVGKDGNYGLVDYNNQVIVPLEYESSCYTVNDEGQSFFNNGTVYTFFDSEGNELCSIDMQGLIVKNINDGIISTSGSSETGEKFVYYSLEGQIIYESNFEDAYDRGGVAFSEGYAFHSSSGSVMRMDKNGNCVSMVDLINKNLTSSAGEISWLEEVPIGPAKDGYYFSRYTVEFFENSGNYILRAVDGSTAYKWDITSIFNREGLSFYYNEIPWAFKTYYENGTPYFNCGTIMCVYLNLDDHYSYYLVDVSKLVEQEIDPFIWEDGDAAYVDAECTLLTDEALLANAEYIGLNSEKYWLIKQDGKWGYIDHGGNIMAMYEDASDFHNGRALIIEDGIAYVIDETLTKVKEIGEAQSVSKFGEIFRVVTESGEVMIMLE